MPPLRIHELKNLKLVRPSSVVPWKTYSFNSAPDQKERKGNRDIYPEADGKYILVKPLSNTKAQNRYAHKNKFSKNMPSVKDQQEIVGEERENIDDEHIEYKGDNIPITIVAAPMQHTIPCVGYVITEDDKPGTMIAKIVNPIVERNRDALNKLYGDYRHVLKDIKVRQGLMLMYACLIFVL